MKSRCVAIISLCPLVMIVSGNLHICNFHNLNDISKSVLVLPEIQCSLDIVIFSDTGHFKGTSLDNRNLPNPLAGKRMESISLDDPLYKIASRYSISIDPSQLIYPSDQFMTVN